MRPPLSPADFRPLPLAPQPDEKTLAARAEAEALLAEANRLHRKAKEEAERLTEEAKGLRAETLAAADVDAQRLRDEAQQHLDGIQARLDAKERRGQKIDEWSPRVALGATILLTASGELSLAVLTGWPPAIAWGLPLAIDIYVVQAMRRHRDVMLALLLMVAANAIYHLAEAGLFGVRTNSRGTLQPEWWLIAGVAAIAPWVMLRIHRITAPPRERRWRRERAAAVVSESSSERATELSQTRSDESGNESAEPSREALSSAVVESPVEPSHEAPVTVPAARSARAESKPKAKPKRRVSKGRPARPAEVSPIGDIDHELAALVALMTERGDADAVKLSDAKRITGKSEPTAARRLSAARAQYRRTA